MKRERREGPRSRSGVPAAASVRARTTIRCASSILNWLSPEGFASASAASAARRNTAASGTGACQDLLGRAGPPWFGGDAAERQPRIARSLPCSIRKRRGGRHDGESERRAFADFQVARMRRERRCVARQPQRDDQIAAARARFPARGVSPGRRCSASSATSRRPVRPSISTTASSATSGTQKSDGWVAMQASLQPSTA